MFRDSRTSRARRGFTLLELVVVIGVVGALISLLMPAVQRARTSAAIIQCTNHLKQIALAAHTFESQNRRLPPGYIGPRNNKSIHTAIAYGDAEDNQWIGQFPFLLPHLDQRGLFQRIQLNLDIDGQSPPWWEPKPSSTGSLPANYDVATQSLAVFRCPLNSDAEIPFQAGSGNGTILGIHVYSTGPFSKFHHWVENYDDGSGQPYSWRLATTDYLGVCGGGRGTSPWWTQWEGVFSNRSRTRLSDIKDGTTSTLMYGEVVGRADVDAATNLRVPDAVTISWFGGGVVPSVYGLAAGKDALWHQFSSYHTKGVPFAFADGSVRTLAMGTDTAVLLQLSGMRDRTVTRVVD